MTEFSAAARKLLEKKRGECPNVHDFGRLCKQCREIEEMAAEAMALGAKAALNVGGPFNPITLDTETGKAIAAEAERLLEKKA